MDKTVVDALELIKENIVSLATKSVMDKLVEKAAFMAWGPLNSLVSMLLGKLLRFVITKTVLELYILKAHYNVDKQVNEVNEVLKEIHSGEKLSDERLKEIDEELIKKARDLINIGNH